MTARAPLGTLLGLATSGLARKPGRNLLTATGVFVGVFALTTIVALGEGMGRLVEATVAGEDNLRQIGLSGGLGHRLDDETREGFEGVREDARRSRLRRAALARTRPGPLIGRRANALDLETLARIRDLPHVVAATPIVLERYRIEAGGRTRDATPTLGADVGRRRYEDRVVAGRYFSAPDAAEALVHEYLAWQWGYRDEAELGRLVGQRLLLHPLGGAAGASGGPAMLQEVLARLDLSALTEEERAALPAIVEKVARAWLGRGAGEIEEAGGPHEVEIVGVVREMEPGDPFHVIEDGNAVTTDVFLPQETAIRFFLASAVNRELGFGRAWVLVDEPAHARAVEDRLREEGYTAFSVVGVVTRIQGILGAATLVVSLLTGVALFVAALGIVNTMLTSVIERTREIGLWKAIGATSGQVRVVFLLEAGLLGLLGGLAGLGLSLLLVGPLDAIAARVLAERFAFPLRTGVFFVPAWLPLAGPALATVVAMLAALQPAGRAARIDPVRALRHE